MHDHREDIDAVLGDVAAVGLKNTTAGIRCDESEQVILESMEFPEPVIRVAIEPKPSRAGKGIALSKHGRRPHL